ncbi:MAG: mechanosensitive ion channel protein, partial [Ignavibacteriales bacterium CG12_big_fil_rev_8_21_14_0_65_30_8]
MLDKNFNPTLSKFITSISNILLQVIVVLAALNTLNFQTTSLVAIIGAAGLAVGFALQGSLSNFASGIMLIIFRLIKINDLITAAGETGFVE